MLGILRLPGKICGAPSLEPCYYGFVDEPGAPHVRARGYRSYARSTHRHDVVTLEACGLGVGQTVLVHTRLSVLGWVVGGAQAVIQDLLQVLGPPGTLVMPTQTWKNLDPFRGVHGQVPEA